MISILILPLVLILGGPFMFGILTTFSWLYWKLRKHFEPQTSLIVVFCLLAAVACLMSAPYWVIGTTGWLISACAYIAFVGMGVPKITRLVRFLKLENDGDDSNDPKLPGDKK